MSIYLIFHTLYDLIIQEGSGNPWERRRMVTVRWSWAVLSSWTLRWCWRRLQAESAALSYGAEPKSQYAHNDHRTHFHKSVPVHRIVHVLQSDLFIGLYGITNGYPTPQWSITTGNLWQWQYLLSLRPGVGRSFSLSQSQACVRVVLSASVEWLQLLAKLTHL